MEEALDLSFDGLLMMMMMMMMIQCEFRNYYSVKHLVVPHCWFLNDTSEDDPSNINIEKKSQV